MRCMFLAIIAASSTLIPPSLAAAQDYAAPGSHAAGYREVTVERPGGGTFQARLFYPATASGADAPFDPAGGPYPGIAFGHGFLQAVEKYQSTLEHLATWGYFAIAPRSQGGIFPNHAQFAEDLRASLTWLESANADAGSPFVGSVDVAAFALSGHSMGGGASILGAAGDGGALVRALAPLAAAETNPSAIDTMPSVGMPAALIAGSEDSIVPTATNSLAMYNNTGAPRSLQVITGGFHCGFIDSDSIFCDSGSISRLEQLEITRRLLTSFFELYLKGNDASWSAVWGPAAQADEAVVHTYDSGVSVDADAVLLDAPAGGEAEIALDVSHVLPTATSFTLFADGADWSVTFDPAQTAVLDPGGVAAQVVATVAVPVDGAGEEVTLILSAEADSDGGTRGYVQVTITATDLIGDIDGDGDVDQADLGELLAAYGTQDGDPDFNSAADLDGDGDVDQADLGALLANYGV